MFYSISRQRFTYLTLGLYRQFRTLSAVNAKAQYNSLSQFMPKPPNPSKQVAEVMEIYESSPHDHVKVELDKPMRKITVAKSLESNDFKHLREMLKRGTIISNASSMVVVLKSDCIVDRVRVFLKMNEIKFDGEWLQLYHELRYSSKPVICVMDGKLHDFGASVAMNCPVRIATNSSIFQATTFDRAMKNHMIDPGLLNTLSNLDYNLGSFLALTNFPLKGRDLWHAGLASVYVPFERIEYLEKHLINLREITPYTIRQNLLYAASDPGAFSLTSQLETINECFGEKNVKRIMEKLREKDTPFALECLELMEKMPASYLVMTKQLLNETLNNTPDKCFNVGYNAFKRKEQFEDELNAMTLGDADSSMENFKERFFESEHIFVQRDNFEVPISQGLLTSEFEWDVYSKVRHDNGKPDFIPNNELFHLYFDLFRGAISSSFVRKQIELERGETFQKSTDFDALKMAFPGNEQRLTSLMGVEKDILKLA